MFVQMMILGQIYVSIDWGVCVCGGGGGGGRGGGELKNHFFNMYFRR